VKCKFSSKHQLSSIKFSFEYYSVSATEVELVNRIAKYPKQLKGLREKENCGDSGFFNFEESCFFVSKDKVTWKEANSKCSGVNFTNIL
jgi:hypothetical protein